MTIPSYLGVVTSQGTPINISVNVATVASGSAPSVGDLLLAHMLKGNLAGSDQHFNAPVGWHRLGGSQNTFGSSIFWKIRESGDSNTLTFSSASTGDKIVAVHCIRGADQTRPICRHSIQRHDSDTWTWLAETTPVADCLAMALSACATNRSGVSPASGWTERVDIAQGVTNPVSMYAQTSGIATSGTSTGTASTPLSGAGVTNLTEHMLVIQPSQTATPKDIRVATGTLTSPTATGNQDITGLGFDCKALIIYSMRQDADATAANGEYMHGIGADDGVTTRFQRSVGITMVSANSTSSRGWNQDTIVSVFFAGNSVSDMLADYSRITDGFRLNWTKVPATGYAFNYIAFGGSDLQAVCGAQDGSASPLTSLPWRPDMIHVVGQNFNSSANQLRSGAGTAQMSLGWLDPCAGSQWSVNQDLSGGNQLRDNSFYAQYAGGVLTYEFGFSQATSTGWSWTGSDTDNFFYLAFNWGNSTYFPAQVEMHRAETSGVAGATQVVPSLGKGQTFTTKKLVHSVSAGLTTSATSLGGVSEGHVRFSYAVVDQDVFGWGRAAGQAMERRRKPNNSFVCATASGDLDSPSKVGAWQDLVTINWATTDTNGNLIGLFTLGFIGQQYDRQVDDTAAVTDSLARVVSSARLPSDALVVTELLTPAVPYVRTASDTAIVTDSVARTLTRSRQASDTAVVTDSLARTTTTYGRQASDTAVVTDSLARVVPFVRTVSDTVAIAELFARTATYVRTASDTAVATDSLARVVPFVRTAADTAAVTESLARTTTYGRQASDIAVVTELLARTATYGRPTSDTAAVADLVTAKVAFARAIVDAVPIVDQISVTVTLANTDVIAVADLLSSTLYFRRSAADVAAISDALATERSTAIRDTLSVADTLARVFDGTRAIFDVADLTDGILVNLAGVFITAVVDAIAVADSLNRAVDSVRPLADAFALVDALTAAPQRTFARALSDVLAALDAAASSCEASRVASDAAIVEDLTSSSAAHVVTVSDVVAIDDVIGTEVDIADVVAVVDVVRKSTAVGKSLSDAASITETLVAQRIYGGAANDVVVVVDDLLASLRSLSVDAVAVTESLGRVVSYARVLSDAPIVEDSFNVDDVVFVLQGIGDGANVGPLAIYTVEDTGPLSISGGPDLSTGPVGFVTRSGDLVAVTDQIVPGVSLAIEVGDLVEATG